MCHRFRGQKEAVPPVPGGHVRFRPQRGAAPPKEARDALQGDFRGGGVLALYATEVRTRNRQRLHNVQARLIRHIGNYILLTLIW